MLLWDLSSCPIYKTKRGYLLVYLPKHPSAHHGTVFMHRVVMENVLGRLLGPEEIVHHRNHNKSDNDATNLELTTKPEHAREHALARPRSGRTMVEATCAHCTRSFAIALHKIQGGQRFCSISCGSSLHEAPQHGTYSSYRRGCRCDSCKHANTDRCRRSREKLAS